MTYYGERSIPGKTCPKCGATLILKTRKDRKENIPIEHRRFLACPNFTSGCGHTQSVTPEIADYIYHLPVPEPYDIGI